MLHHVADSILKGIGEQVYSMWVNIFDVMISIALVFFLLPVMGISGYAIVIIVMEGFNFALSVLRLKKRISFSISFLSSLILPAVSALGSALFTSLMIVEKGESVSLMLLFIKLALAVCIFLAIYSLLSLISGLLKDKKGFTSIV